MGHEVFSFDPDSLIPRFPLLQSLNVRTGFRLFVRRIDQKLRQVLKEKTWELAWVDTGPELCPSFYRWLRLRGKPVVNYNLDNPFTPRDHRKWDQYKKSLPLQDFTFLPRKESVEQASSHGARRAVFVPRTFDPVAHHPSRTGKSKPRQGGVVFVGTHMPERGGFLKVLLDRGVPLKIHGDRWQRDRHWRALKKAWAGPALFGAAYVRVIHEASVALGLLSLGNRDEDTTRSVEIPFIGGAVFCAQRTPVHLRMYGEGEEALFWDSPEECAQKCLEILADPDRAGHLAARARHRVIQAGLSNDEVLSGVLSLIKTDFREAPLVKA